MNYFRIVIIICKLEILVEIGVNIEVQIEMVDDFCMWQLGWGIKDGLILMFFY